MSRPMKLMLAAAETGDATSQFNLGVIYDNRLDDNGKAVRGNRAEAIKWLRQAAEQGLPHAQTKLAEVYAGGSQAGGDHVRACTWFLCAASSSSGAHRQKAQSGYERLSAQMPPGQIAKANRLARTWKPKRPDDADAG